jgi:hypothetical protein
MKRRILTVHYLVIMAWSLAAAEEINVRAVFDEADAALAIMENLNAGESVTGEQWQTLWQSEGYTRLLARQASMDLDEGFGDKLAAWLQDPANYNRVATIRNAVDRYRSFDVNTVGDRAGVYLPEAVMLEASFYPVIKHTTNTFVYDLNGDPAIFMSVDPENNRNFVQAVMTHELHHIGLSQCPEIAGYMNLTEDQQWVTNMLTIFGEGLAVLATAGGPDTHPHFYNTPDEWAIWERDVTNIASDQTRIESFFLAVLDGTQAKDERRKTLFTFIVTPEVPQGPAYTLGWKMASLVEARFGRDALVGAMCDPRELLTLYNRAARETHADGVPNLPVWSDELIQGLYAQ